MNDFTKEDLVSILSWAQAYTEFGHCWNYEIYKPLMDKIKFMIKNYCDDDEEIPDLIYPGNKCQKCNQLIFGWLGCPCEKL